MAVNNFYSGRRNISLRKEFDSLLLGDDLGVPTGIPMLLKETKVDPITKIPIPCDCIDPVTREPDKDTPCPFCGGSGYVFEEKVLYGHKFQRVNAVYKDDFSQIGKLGVDTYSVYFRSSEVLGRIDSLYSIAMTEDGVIENPIRRLSEYSIINVGYIRVDESRTEFIKLFVRAIDGTQRNTHRDIE